MDRSGQLGTLLGCHVIQTEWDEAAAEVGLLESDKQFLWNRMILNPYCLEDYY